MPFIHHPVQEFRDYQTLLENRYGELQDAQPRQFFALASEAHNDIFGTQMRIRDGLQLYLGNSLKALAAEALQRDIDRRTLLMQKQFLREAKREAVFSALESIRKRPGTRANAHLLTRLNTLPSELRRKVLNDLSGSPGTFPPTSHE